MSNQSCVCLGFGYSASYFAQRLIDEGWQVVGTTRSQDKAAPGVALIEPDDPVLLEALRQADAVLVSVPPGKGQSFMLNLCRKADFPQLKWLGYLSSTGVYGDHSGAWVDEDTVPRPFDDRSRARFDAERQWLELGEQQTLPVHAFRLSGIYGPGRNVLRQLKAGVARRIIKEGHFFSRIHVEDIAQTLVASLKQPMPGEIYNLADDLPAPSHELSEFAAELLGLEPPPAEIYDENRVSDMMRSFYAANRRISNMKIKEQLGILLAYPTYKEGLKALAKE